MSGECFLFSVLLFAPVLIFFELLHKAIHAQENKEAARKKVAVAEELRNMKLKEAAKNVSESEELDLYAARIRIKGEGDNSAQYYGG